MTIEGMHYSENCECEGCKRVSGRSKKIGATSIHQAIEEERERVKKVIDEPLNFDSRTSATLRDEIVKIINHERQRILSSLDKPLTEKEIEEMPQMKGTLEALNNLTIIK